MLVPGFVPTENHTKPSPDTAFLAAVRVEYQELVGGFEVPALGWDGGVFDSWNTVKFDAPSSPSAPSVPSVPFEPSILVGACQVVLNP